MVFENSRCPQWFKELLGAWEDVPRGWPGV